MPERIIADDPRSQLLKCGHCGNTSVMNIICDGSHENSYEIEAYREPVGTVEVWHKWQILRCSTCNDVNVVEYSAASEDMYETNEWDPIAKDHSTIVTPIWTKSVIYPTRVRFGHAPATVAHAYDQALDVLYFQPTAFAIMVGRTLEAVVKDRRAKGRSLAMKLQHLADVGEIPPRLAQIADNIRWFRNISAHADEVPDLTMDDAFLLRDLCDAILEYVYESRHALETVISRRDELENIRPQK